MACMCDWCRILDIKARHAIVPTTDRTDSLVKCGVKQWNDKAIYDEKHDCERSTNPARDQCLTITHIAQQLAKVGRINRIVRLTATPAVFYYVLK
jgi:hypothetical protein